MRSRFKSDRTYLLCLEDAYLAAAQECSGCAYVRAKKVRKGVVILDTPNQIRLFDDVRVPWSAILITPQEAKAILSSKK